MKLIKMRLESVSKGETPIGAFVKDVGSRKPGLARKIQMRGLAILGDRIFTEWQQRITKVTAAHPGWGKKYFDSIKMYRDGVSIVIEGGTDEDSSKFVTFVEEGIGSWRMRDKMAPGEVRVIPFRHFTPSAIRNPSMPPGIYKQMRKALAEGKKTIHVPASKAEKKKGYTAGIYSGMRRYGGRFQGEYMTFRTLSQEKKPGAAAWEYPAIPKTPVYPWVKKNVPKWAEESFASAAVAVGKSFVVAAQRRTARV